MTPAERERLLDRVKLLLQRYLEPARFAEVVPVDVALQRLDGEPVSYAEALDGDFAPSRVGERWGSAWSTSWFRLRGEIPAAWAGRRVDLRIDLSDGRQPDFGAEGLLWRDGAPFFGLNDQHRWVSVAAPARGGESIELYLEAACNPKPGPGRRLDPDYGGEARLTLQRAELAVHDEDISAALADFAVVTALANDLPLEGRRSAEVLASLRSAAALLEEADPKRAAKGAQAVLAGALAQPASPHSHHVSAVGHAHIDSAWLWPIRETVRKCARTFSTTLKLLEEHPELHFVCSQAQQHNWMRERYPELFHRMQQLSEAGQFHPVGSMWVEPDCNVPSGESLVRQVLYGKRFFQEAYGVETFDCWLPDAFGYSGALPQILVQAGIRLFISQKLSWNETSRHPHHTFWWEGIDGTRILAHFPPADTYNGEMTVDELRYSERNFSDHATSGVSLYPFGHGDGGGGLTEEMLQRAERLADLDGVPRVTLESLEDFARRLDPPSPQLDTWVGELYLEYHRGTLTSLAAIKSGNRRGEAALYEAELWSSLLGIGSDSATRAELAGAWRTLLLHQFHDILPGSSINRVNRETIAAQAELLASMAALRARVGAALAGSVDTRGTQVPVLVTNPTGHARREVVSLGSQALAGSESAARLVTVGPDGTASPVQQSAGGELLAMVSVPACGWALYDLRPIRSDGENSEEQAERVVAEVGRLENRRLRVEIDESGLLASVYDKLAEREVLAPGSSGNVFVLYADDPAYHDAWNLDEFYVDRSEQLVEAESVELVESGPLRASVRVRRRFGSSTLEQLIRLDADSSRIDFVTRVDWQERHRLLKTIFPVAVHSTRASYEIQFGYLERATHSNTDWDRARFEVCGHRFVDLSEPGYGVALLNDGKYGHRVQGSTLELSLLRAPTAPDPDADRGRHSFTYSLFPHLGSLQDARVVEEAAALNLALSSVPAARNRQGERGPQQSLVSFDRPGVALSAVKHAEDDDDLVIRLYEANGSRGPVRLLVGLEVERAFRCDLLERVTAKLPVDGSPAGSTLQLELRPFEIVTLKLALR